MPSRLLLATLTLALAPAALGGCRRTSCEGDDSDLVRPAEWTEASHCPGVAPNYDEVFREDVVQEIDLVMSAENHAASLDDLDSKYSSGSSVADPDALDKPRWFPVTVNYRGKTWTEVGMRYKGHASLKGAWQRGIRKLSFALEFDHYEDTSPDLKNQRFYGFRKLTFGNAYNDPSLLREKTSAAIFRAGGVPAARSSFARVQLDWGEGLAYLGLYTIVEDACDSLRQSQIGDASGALYKPWGDAARWLSLAEVGAQDLATHFETCKSSDPPAGDDVAAAIKALHQDREGAASWRAGLEKVFNVDAFLRALAINQAIMNWDSYGCMHHNYFVYANPLDQGRFLWIPWDLNESMMAKTQEGCPAPGSVMLGEIVEGTDSKIDGDWPLIAFLLKDSVYLAAYKKHLRTALDGAFAEAAVIAKMRKDHELIAPFVVGPQRVEAFPYTNTTQAAFQSSLTSGDGALEPHVKARHQAVEAALSAQ